MKPKSIRELIRQFQTGIPSAQLLRLADQTPVNAVVTLLLVFMVLAFVVTQVSAPWMYAWAAAQSGIALIVFLRWRKMAKPRALKSDTPNAMTRAGLHRAVLWAALSGGLWGSLTALLPDVPTHMQVALILCMGGMAAGASTTLASVQQVAIVYILGCGLPVTLYYLTMGSHVGLLLALACSTFLAGLIGTSRIVNAALLRQLSAEAYVRQLQEAGLQQRVAAMVNEAASVDESLQYGVDEVCRYTGWPAGLVYLLADDGTNELVSSGIWHVESEERFREVFQLTESSRIVYGQGVAGRVLASVRPYWRAEGMDALDSPLTTKAGNSNPEFPLSTAIRNAGIKATLGFPVTVGPDIVAVLGFFSESAARPNDALMETLAAVANVLGRAIERRQSEENLRQSEEKFRTLIESSAMGVLVHRNGKFLYVNEEGARSLGYDVDEMLALDSILDVVSSNDRERVKTLAGEAAANTYEFEAIHGDGHVITLHARTSTIEWHGETAQLMTVADISERRQAEEKLRQAQKMEVVGQLTSGITHDFNNVLAVVMGNLELAMGSVREGRDAEGFLSAAMQGAQTGADLNRQLLSFSRRQIMEKKVANINEIVRNLSGLLKRTLGEKIRIETVLSEQECFSRLDPAELESAMLNLALNARDAMSSGGTLTVEAGVIDREQFPGVADLEDSMVHILISDNGTGMPSHVRERALEPFYTTKETGVGSGLGLSMVFGFIQSSGGQLDIDSKHGEGTDVHLFLPRCERDELTRPDNTLPMTESATNGGLVLVVEDQKEVMDTICRTLDTIGYRVLAACDGKEAMRKIEDSEENIDLVLSDITLPGEIDGIDIAAMVARIKPRMKVILMSGDIGKAARDTDGGFPDIRLLRKPFKKVDLERALHEALPG